MAKSGKSQGSGKTVIRRRTIIEEVPEGQESHTPNWFSKNPVGAIVLGIIVLILLFAPLFPSTKTVQTTETVMVPVATEETVPGTPVNKTIKTYTGWICDDNGVMTTIDAVAGVVSFSQARGPNDTWIVTTTDSNGYQVIYRDIIQIDLTKTGTTTAEATTGAVTKTGTQMIPQQVTKDKQIQTRVSLFQYLFGGN